MRFAFARIDLRRSAACGIVPARPAPAFAATPARATVQSFRIRRGRRSPGLGF
jgi:hypothetical protein